MKTKVKEVYYCEFCKKKGMVRALMEHHEKYCTANPVNKSACYGTSGGCAFLEKVEHSQHPYYGDVIGYQFCQKHQKKLYSAKALRLKLDKQHPEHFADQELMPTDCADFKEFELPYD